jgi:hypothetical protein
MRTVDVALSEEGADGARHLRGRGLCLAGDGIGVTMAGQIDGVHREVAREVVDD